MHVLAHGRIKSVAVCGARSPLHARLLRLIPIGFPNVFVR